MITLQAMVVFNGFNVYHHIILNLYIILVFFRIYRLDDFGIIKVETGHPLILFNLARVIQLPYEEVGVKVLLRPTPGKCVTTAI